MPADDRRAAGFISYASADQATAQLLSDQLEGAGISSSRDAVLVMLSPAAIASPHVRREVSLAIDERRALLPVALPGTTYPAGFSTEWTYWLGAVQVMDYLGPQHTLQRLRSVVPQDQRNRLGEETTARRQPTGALRRRLSGRSSSPSALLRPDSSGSALLGRENELARLEQWCLRDNDFDVRMVTGAAGQGKSRLARELMWLLTCRYDLRIQNHAEHWTTSIAHGIASTPRSPPAGVPRRGPRPRTRPC